MKVSSFQMQAGSNSVPPDSALDSPQTVVFAFGAPEFLRQPKAFEDLKKAFPQSVLMGCSSAGEIFGNKVYDKTLAVAVAKLEKTKISAISLPISAGFESFGVGKMLASKLKGPDLTGIVILSDGLKVNGSELIRGVNSVVGPNVIVTGGLAGDGSRFEQTWVIQNGKPAAGFVTAIAFYGKSIQIGHGSQGGWDAVGSEMEITRSLGNVLYELDGKYALDLYKKYLGEKASGLPASALLFPLQIRSKDNSTRKIVRTILSIDEAEKGMVFAGDIPQGYMAQFMSANFDRLVEGSSKAARLIKPGSAQGSETLALAVSCVGRRLVLGDRTNDELSATLNILPKGVHQIGFYSYGEISPYVQGASCELHNQTMTLTTISEAA